MDRKVVPANDDGDEDLGIQIGVADLNDSKHEKIELIWPGKDTVTRVEQGQDGQWQLGVGIDSHRVCPLLDLDTYPASESTVRSLAITGDRIAALRTLSRSIGRTIRLAYIDAPRIGIDDAASAFRGDQSLVYSSWLSVIRAHLAAMEPLLRRDGVVVLHVGETEAGFARLLADEQFRGQRVGTVVWQRAYAPRNMKGMREFTSTHDCLLIYAKQRDALPPVGLRAIPSGFANPDGDPRGPWKAEHKGAKARRAKSDFDTYVPPYRWRLASGQLPRGLWRVSPLTGVIWGVPEETGRFPLAVEVLDSDGASKVQKFVLEVAKEGEPPPLPAIPWIFEEFTTSGELRFGTKHVPAAILGKEYSAVLLGAGGKPFRAAPKRPGSGRYWEFADDTLVEAYQKDAVYLGRAEQPTAIPHPKAYAPPDGELAVENQQTWWPGRTQDGSNSSAFTGYTEDATKHLKALKELGLITTETSSAKPEYLLARLVDIFTDKDDLVLELFGASADMAAIALKRQRRFVLLGGAADRDLDMFRGCALPRLRAVVDGRDKDLHEQVSEIRMRADAYIPYDGGGSFTTARMGEWIVERRKREELATLNLSAYGDPEVLQRGILTAEGFVPTSLTMTFGISLRDEGAAAVVIPSDQFLTTEVASEWIGRLLGQFTSVTIYYFRSSADFDTSVLPVGVTSKRVPFDLGI